MEGAVINSNIEIVFIYSNSLQPKMSARNMAEYWANRRPSIFTPPESYLTENLDQTKLMPETSYRNKFLIAMDLVVHESSPGPFVFIQVLNDNSPEGKCNRYARPEVIYLPDVDINYTVCTNDS